MRPGEKGSILKLDTRPEYRAVYAGLAMIDEDTLTLRQQVFYGFNETDYQAPFNPIEGSYKHKPRTDEQLGFNIDTSNLDTIRNACEATLAAKGINGAKLRVTRAKAAAGAILANMPAA